MLLRNSLVVTQLTIKSGDMVGKKRVKKYKLTRLPAATLSLKKPESTFCDLKQDIGPL